MTKPKDYAKALAQLGVSADSLFPHASRSKNPMRFLALIEGHRGKPPTGREPRQAGVSHDDVFAGQSLAQELGIETR